MGKALEHRRLVEWARAMPPGRRSPSKAGVRPAAPLARSSATASVVAEEGGKNEVELLYPRLVAGAV